MMRVEDMPDPFRGEAEVDHLRLEHDDDQKLIRELRRALDVVKANNARLVEERDALRVQIGKPPAGSHPDETVPRAATWHEERANWRAEVERLRGERQRAFADADRALGAMQSAADRRGHETMVATLEAARTVVAAVQ